MFHGFYDCGPYCAKHEQDTEDWNREKDLEESSDQFDQVNDEIHNVISFL